MCAGIIGSQRDQSLQRRLRLIHPAQEIERHGLIIAIFAIVRLTRNGGQKMGQGRLMPPQSRIDAAQRIEAERILRQVLLGLLQHLRGLAIAAQQAEHTGELGAIFAAP